MVYIKRYGGKGTKKMNELVKNSIDAKRKAMFDYHDIENKKLLEKIDNYFKKVEDFGSKYNDIMKFENDFASSPLMKEYTDIFTEIVTKENVSTMIEETSVVDEVKDSVKNRMRRDIREKRDNELRNMPVIGDILEVKQHIDLFSKFRKNKD